NRSNAAALAALDRLVQVFKAPAQALAQSPAHAGLSRPHKPHQKNERNALVAHAIRYTKTYSLEPESRIYLSFLEPDFTTEGFQHHRRGCLPDSTCKGTSGNDREAGVRFG